MTQQQPAAVPPKTAQFERRWSALWLIGCHGGAGASTLAAVGVGFDGGTGRWPATNGTAGVLIVCRASATGLRAAAHVATAVQRREVPAGLEVAGLVVVAAQPGREPKIIRERAQLVGGWFPAVWQVPWVSEVIATEREQLRYCKPFKAAIPAALFHINDRGRPNT
jgi:hypothetical protein